MDTSKPGPFPIFRYLLCLLLLILQQASKAQTYPIAISTQVIPPYSVYLPDYAVPGSDKLRVILIQNDLGQPSYSIRLQMTVERNGTLIMRTAPTYTPKPLLLSPGIPTIIGGNELYDYLSAANIEFSGGFSRDEYERTKSLPEGAYRISFAAFDYRRPEVQVSNAGSNVFFFQKSDPPLLNLPVCGSRVEKRDPQFLSFSWSSRNTPNPLPGSGTEYVFSLYEIKPAGSNPDYILRSARPIFTTVTEMTNLIYTQAEPALTDSMQYVWAVQARDKSGRDMFSNQGLSKSCTFTYLGANPFTQFGIPKPKLSAVATGARSIRYSWPLAQANAGYQVEAYRLQFRAAEKDGVEFDWQTEEKLEDTAFTSDNLEPARLYEARLQWKVTGVYGPFSDVVKVMTDSTKTFKCGDENLAPVSTNTKVLSSAIVGDIIKSGNFEVRLLEVTGGDGIFSGKGKVITKGFGSGLLVEFKKITINTDKVVLKGEMQAVTKGIDKFVSDALSEQHGGGDVGQVKTGDVKPSIITKLYIFSPDSVVVNTEDSTITLLGRDGEKEVIDYGTGTKTLPLVLEDAGGNLYNIDKNGKVTAAGRRDPSLAGNSAALAALNNLQLENGRVTFSASADSKYAFDAWKDAYAGHAKLDSSYELLAKGQYRVSVKAIVPGGQDEVKATLKDANGIAPEKLVFVSGTGITYPAERNGNTFTITLTGGPGGDAQEIYAAYKGPDSAYISVGKLLVVSYMQLQKKLILVPVGANTNVPEDAIRKSLQEAYEAIGVAYTVEVDESFRNDTSWDINHDQQLQDTKSSFLSSAYTGEEKRMKKAYTSLHNIDDNAVYLFVINEAALLDGDLRGKMPRGGQFGFLFIKNATDEVIGRTAAHEAGHGVFTLEHTFAESIGLPQNTTDNLMDAGHGYELLKYQWDIVHDPGNVWGIFEDDADGQSQGTEYLPGMFLDKDNKFTFITYGGQYITLPYNANNFVFHFGISDVATTKNLVTGVLQGFEIDHKGYRASLDGGVVRYVAADGTVYKNSSPPWKTLEGVIMALPYKYSLYAFKLGVTGLQPYNPDAPVAVKNEFDFPVLPFSEANPLLNSDLGQPLIYNMGQVTAECAWCYNDTIRKMVADHSLKPQILYVSKIAQLRRAYPADFYRFTSTGSDWAFPRKADNSSTRSDAHEPAFEPVGWWGEKIDADPAGQLKGLYEREDGKPLFFRQMLSELLTFTERGSAERTSFFDTVTTRCDIMKIIDVVNPTANAECTNININARDTLLKVLTADWTFAGVSMNGIDFDIDFITEHQMAILKLVKYIKRWDIPALLRMLHDEKMLEPIVKNISDDAIRYEVTDSILSYLRQNPDEWIDQAFNKEYIFTNNKQKYTNSPVTMKGNQVKMVYREISDLDSTGKPKPRPFPEEAYRGTITIDLYETVIFLLEEDYKVFGATRYKTGDYLGGVKMTGLELFFLTNERTKQASRTLTEMVKTAWELVLGAKELTAAAELAVAGELTAAQKWEQYLKMMDMLQKIFEVTYDAGTRNQLKEQYPQSEKYFEIWDTIHSTYSSARDLQGKREKVLEYRKRLIEEAEKLNKDPSIPKTLKEVWKLGQLIKDLSE